MKKILPNSVAKECECWQSNSNPGSSWRK